MRTIVLETYIDAPPEVCFDLCLDVQEHVKSIGGSDERIVGGVKEGLLGLGDTLVLEGRHLGLRWQLGVKISAFDRPSRFVDEMFKGPFKSVWHEHLFEPQGTGTRMRDTFRFAAPLGPLGLLAEWLVLERYMGGLIRGRNAHIKRVAESRR